jgi:hypothetical protein
MIEIDDLDERSLLYTYYPFPKQQLMCTYYYPRKHHPWIACIYLSGFRSIIEPYQESDALVDGGKIIISTTQLTSECLYAASVSEYGAFISTYSARQYTSNSRQFMAR